MNAKLKKDKAERIYAFIDSQILKISNFRNAIEYRKKGQKPRAINKKIKKTEISVRSKPEAALLGHGDN